jgi:hypothetical protein
LTDSAPILEAEQSVTVRLIDNNAAK